MAVVVHPEQNMPEVFTPPLSDPEDFQALAKPAEPGENALVPAPLTTGARLLVAMVVLAAVAILANAAIFWQSPDLIKFGAFLSISLISAGARVRVPGVSGPLPLSYLFVLLGLVELTSSETILLAGLVAVVQCYWNRPQRPRISFVLLQAGVMIAAAAAAERVYHSSWFEFSEVHTSLRLAVATLALFLINTAPIAKWTAIVESGSFAGVWLSTSFWSLPHYLAGAVVARAVSLAAHYVAWQTVLLTGPVVYLIYRSYRLYLNRLEAETKHAEEVASLHLRTIEALALAIEAKDHTTHDHLQRVQVYARELAASLALTESELQALQAAALLHDIGKLAVPEHIISKPGKLTPEEFEKMKIHPVVGAEILERVRFPYPVAPIVRAHHEKWDGTWIPQRAQRRRDSDRGAHPGGCGLPGRARFRPAVSACDAARRGDESGPVGSRAGFRSARGGRSGSRLRAVGAQGEASRTQAGGFVQRCQDRARTGAGGGL